MGRRAGEETAPPTVAAEVVLTVVDGRRAVGDRNRVAILEAAIGVLGAQPDAGIAEVAAAAGVGRATVYRHFAAREELIEALRLHASEEARLASRRRASTRATRSRRSSGWSQRCSRSATATA